jgi:hypothetical protein
MHRLGTVLGGSERTHLDWQYVVGRNVNGEREAAALLANEELPNIHFTGLIKLWLSWLDPLAGGHRGTLRHR